MVFIIPNFLFLLDTGHSLAKGIMSYNPIEFWDGLGLFLDYDLIAKDWIITTGRG